MSIRILHQNCDLELAQDRNLPYTAYVVWYENEGSICYDIVIPNKKVDIFDYYWDRYREGLKGFQQTEGRVNPKMWGNTTNDSKNKKR